MCTANSHSHVVVGAPKPQRRAARGASSWAAGVFVSRNPYPMGASLHTRVIYYNTQANQINLDGNALLVGSNDTNNVRHETLSH